ncbi:sensor histidine kinase [Actinomycetospora sp. C-140]
MSEFDAPGAPRPERESSPRGWWASVREARSPRRWRVATKVVAAVLVPLVLALVLAAVVVRGQIAERTALAQVAAGTRVDGTVAALVDDLQVERSQTAAYVAGDRRGDRAPLDITADRVDADVAALRAAGPAVADLDPGVQYRYGVALARLDGLGALRSTAIASRYPASSVITAYTGLIEPLLALDRDIAGAAGQTAVVRPATALAALGRAKEQAEIQHAVLLLGATTGALSADDAGELRSADAEQTAATAEFEAGATPAQVQAFDDTVAGPDVDQRVRILQTTLLRDAASQPLAADPGAWDRAAGATREALRTVETGMLDELRTTADRLVAEATTAAVVVGLLVALGVVLAVVLAVAIAASLITPLRRLRFSALDIAERRLPAAVHRLENVDGVPEDGEDEIAPVAIDTDEEVGEVARAFDTVHREAVRLAGEQARLRTNLNALFVNLSRRSQSLVERQLTLIDTLEGREEDPDVLAELFALDHLATRMRRNGENLLVLGGSAPARGTSEPVPAVDLVRAAVAEIEDYRRIEVRPMPGVHLPGGPADDLTHLLAELMDNATTYSSPETPVVVSGSRAPDGGLIIEITDEGIGMDAEDLADANSRLERAVLLDASVPRQMGLFVVGALARRHDIVAGLVAGEDAGLTAVVQVPPTLLVRALSPRAPQETADAEPDPVTAPTASIDGDGTRDGTADDLPADPAADDGVLEPIYQEMCSAWFRENGDHGSDGAIPTPREETVPEGSVWWSTADEGWDAVAAREAARDVAPEREHTEAGLPRRRRGEELVPGAVGADVPEPRRTVDAGALRARMGSFQAGTHRGRREVDTDPEGLPVRDDETAGRPR